jgi:class 3 adenylate cyclase/tetratricopeptide (TPR) repeat protein
VVAGSDLTAEGPGLILVLVDCPVCGHDNRAQAKFCEECAALLPRAQPDPSSFTPVDLAEKIRRQRPSEGERRTVTVLFVDAVGSTPLAEKLGEEEMYSLMREALSRMSEAVHAYEGHVATFTGDGMMALFGAPIAHEDSARRAIAAALRMQSALEEYGHGVEQHHGVPCRFRVGLNTGPVVVGTVTDDLRMDFTAIGDTVNLAARMEQMADPGGVLVSDDTHRAAADFFEWDAVGELAVKGKVGPVPAYRVLREKAVRTRFEAAAERGLSPLVGRARELALLESQVALVRDGAGQVVFVSGEAGIGKSRLVLELRRRLADVRWLEGHCASYAQNSPYLPFVDVLKGAFAIAESDDDARVITRVDDAVADWEEGAQKRVPYLKYALSVDPGDEAVVTMDPQERRVEVFEAFGALLVEESRHRPLVIVVEDLHWADQMSREALARLLPVVASLSLLLVLTHRPDYDRPAGDFTVLDLEPLDQAESAVLTRGVFGVEGLPPEVQRLVIGKAEGNPFYIEEVSKALVETGVVARVDGGYRLQRPAEEVHIPGTIQEVILSRIDRLEREAKQVIQLASVIGREFTARVLERISDLEATLSEVLGELKALELIYEKGYFPELAYMFKHALTHDVAYSTLLAKRRRALHAIVAAAVEELYSDRLPDQYETLAHHWYEAEKWEKALEYLLKAGDKAADTFANRAALVFFARALEVASRLGDARTEAAVAERKSLIDLTVVDLPAALVDTERMGQAGQQLGDRRIQGRALARRGRVELVDHEFEAAEASFRAALAVGGEYDDVRFLATFGLYYHQAGLFGPVAAEPLDRALREMAPAIDDATMAMWTYLAMLMERGVGRYDLVLERARHWRETTGNRGADSPSLAQVLWAEALTLTEKGDYEQALATFFRVNAMTERMGDAFRRGRVLNSIGWLYNEVAHHDEALSWNVRAVEFAQAYPAADAEMESNARLNLADTLMALGRLDEADEHFAWVDRVVRQPTPKERWVLYRYSQHLLHSYGEFWLQRGKPRRALDYADECLSRAEATGAARYVVKARRLRGQALMVLGDLEGAEREIILALGVAQKLGNPPQLWMTHAAMGELRRAQGRTEDARGAYGVAISIIEDVGRSLKDKQLRETFLGSKHAEGIRQAAELRP